MTRAATLLLVLAALSGCSGGDGVPQPVAVGMPAPPYSGLTLAGDSTSLATHRGRVVVLNVWATWCTPCRDEIPALQKVHEKFVARGLDVIGVSIDAEGDESKIQKFIREFGMTYPVWRDPSERVSATFLVLGIPSTFVVGRDGTVLFRHAGPVKDTDARLLSAIEKGLAQAD